MKEKYSLSGWKLGKWIIGNWKTLREILKIGIPLAVAWATTNNPALIGLITLGGKFLLDLGHYYLKEYE